MTLTPSSLRTDLKCGKGAISKGEKCTKGAATAVNPTAQGRDRTPHLKWPLLVVLLSVLVI
jgi:hypothetical protein